MFEMLRECEPWDRFCDRHSLTIGYFNLFHLGGAVNRYVVRKPGAAQSHDDWNFTTSFPPERMGQLPMTVIHTGPPGANWSGRTARSYHAEEAAVSRELPGEIAGKGTVAVVGYFPGSRWREVAGRFAKVLLVDHCQVHHPSGSPVVEADRAALRVLWEKEAAGCGGVELLGTHSAGTLAKIADGSLDALYLPGEATPDWLVAALPHWMEKLKEGAIIFGDLYGLPHWPDSTYALSLLLGPPDEVMPGGFWWKRWIRPVKPWLGKTAGMGNERGFVLVNEGTEQVGKLIVSLQSVREWWSGLIALYHWGEVNHGLRIAAAYYEVRLHEVGELGAYLSASVVEEAAEMMAFDSGIVLPVGTLLVANPASLFSQELPVEEGGGESLFLVKRSGFRFRRYSLPSASAGDFIQSSAVGTSLLRCEGSPEPWTEDAWAKWSVAEAGATHALAAPIRVPADTTVVVLVSSADMAEFESTWLMLKFAVRVPVILVLVGVKKQEMWLAGNAQPVECLEVSASATSGEILTRISRTVQTRRVVLIPPIARPLPGAELFTNHVRTDDRTVFHGLSRSPDETDPRRLDLPMFGTMPAALLVKVAEFVRKRIPESGGVGVAIRDGLQACGVKITVRDLRASGWEFPVASRFVRSNLLSSALPL